MIIIRRSGRGVVGLCRLRCECRCNQRGKLLRNWDLNTLAGLTLVYIGKEYGTRGITRMEGKQAQGRREASSPVWFHYANQMEEKLIDTAIRGTCTKKR